MAADSRKRDDLRHTDGRLRKPKPVARMCTQRPSDECGRSVDHPDRATSSPSSLPSSRRQSKVAAREAHRNAADHRLGGPSGAAHVMFFSEPPVMPTIPSRQGGNFTRCKTNRLMRRSTCGGFDMRPLRIRSTHDFDEYLASGFGSARFSPGIEASLWRRGRRKDCGVVVGIDLHLDVGRIATERDAPGHLNPTDVMVGGKLEDVPVH